MSNLEIWNSLSETDPKYTKSFKRAGGFSGTAQNPTYAIKKMTDHFGPCGKGWGIGKPEFTIHDAGEAGVLVYSTISLWYMDGAQRCETWGVGGDTAVTKTKFGLTADDEAFKKATTDALTNAMKTLGVAADLHLGMYDDSKYLNGLKEKFAESEKDAAKKLEDRAKELQVEEALKCIESALTEEELKKFFSEGWGKWKDKETQDKLKAIYDKRKKDFEPKGAVAKKHDLVEKQIKHLQPVELDDSIPDFEVPK